MQRPPTAQSAVRKAASHQADALARDQHRTRVCVDKCLKKISLIPSNRLTLQILVEFVADLSSDFPDQLNQVERLAPALKIAFFKAGGFAARTRQHRGRPTFEVAPHCVGS